MNNDSLFRLAEIVSTLADGLHGFLQQHHDTNSPFFDLLQTLANDADKLATDLEEKANQQGNSSSPESEA